MAKRLTNEQRQALITKIDALRKQGLSAAAACKKAGANINNYNYWMRSAKKPTGAKRVLKTGGTRTAKANPGLKAFNVNLASGKSQPLVIAIGHPKDVNAALANLAAMFGGGRA